MLSVNVPDSNVSIDLGPFGQESSRFYYCLLGY